MSKPNLSSVKIELEHILSSKVFKKSNVLSNFLRYVVTETLEEKTNEIKEYSIAVKVLGKPADFNLQLDAIVRIQAGRLRRALKEYCREIGNDDTIVIEIPKGSYIALFQSQNKRENGIQKVKSASNRPVVSVLPFRNISNNTSRNFFADGLGDQLSTELTRFQDLSVISYHSSLHAAGQTSDIKEATKLLRATYVLTGSIQSDAKHLAFRRN